MIEQSLIYIMSYIQKNSVYILISIAIIAIIILIAYFLSISKKSNFSEQTSAEQNKNIMKAAILLYNESFAGRENGQEDSNWNNKLYNQELGIVIDEKFFQKNFIIPANIANGKWVRLSMPRF